MNMINFYPGPSKIYPQVKNWMLDAMDSGILAMNHRSDDFMQMLAGAIARMKNKLLIPESYEIFLVSSSTECWEIIAQSLVGKKSLHMYNGAFGKKWWEYTQKIKPDARGHCFGTEDLLCLPDNHDEYEVLCLTHNETSNGTSIPEHVLKEVRNQFSGIITVDATSSMGGVTMDWSVADVWFASVQKCFGMPPGLAIMVVSPNAMIKAAEINDQTFYNSLLFIAENFRKFQTPYTPNILGIYLLHRLFEDVQPIQFIDQVTHQTAEEWFEFLQNRNIDLLVSNPEVRSSTVIPFITRTAEQTYELKQYLLQNNIVIGSGYGKWKDNTLRIANFPAIADIERMKLKGQLDKYYWGSKA